MIKQIENHYKLIFLFLSFFFIINVKSQDRIIYTQEKSISFTNKYILYPKSKKFEHKYTTDDGQIWFGKGTYIIKKKKIFFTFKDIHNPNSIRLNFYSDNKMSKFITIKFLDLKGYAVNNSISYNGKIYFSNFDGNIILNKTIFNETTPYITIMQNNYIHKIEFKNLVYLKSIDIIQKKTILKTHYEKNFIRILRYNKKCLISKDFYNTSKKEKVKFIIE